MSEGASTDPKMLKIPKARECERMLSVCALFIPHITDMFSLYSLSEVLSVFSAGRQLFGLTSFYMLNK